VGGVFEGILIGLSDVSLPSTAQLIIAKSVWGICYGAGFGAGLGWAFYRCQEQTRRLLESHET
jgi:hypothetical protein